MNSIQTKRQAAFGAFSQDIVTLYEKHQLDRSRLDQLASQYKPFAPDDSTWPVRVAQDGKDLCHICIELIDPTFPLATRGSREDNDEYWEREFHKWEEIMYTRWGWQRLRISPQEKSGTFQAGKALASPLVHH